MSSHYSFVYYPYAEEQGDLVFQDDDVSKDWFKHSSKKRIL
jgi:hypothetical protein